MLKNKETEDTSLINVEEAKKSLEQREKEGKGYTKEEEEQINAFYESLIKKHLNPRVQEISYYMSLTNKKLDDIYIDIKEKKSGLSTLNRSFLISFERPFINSLFAEKYQ